MPSLLKRLFRRKTDDHHHDGKGSKKSKKLSKKERKAAKKEDGSFNVSGAGGVDASKQKNASAGAGGTPTKSLSPGGPVKGEEEPATRRPSLKTESLSSSVGRDASRESNASKYLNSPARNGGNGLTDAALQGLAAHSSPRLGGALSPRSAGGAPDDALSPSKRSTGPVDLDEDDEDDYSDSERENQDPRAANTSSMSASTSASPKLSHRQLQEFDLQHGNAFQHPHHLYAPPDEFRKPQLSRLSDGQLVEMGPPGVGMGSTLGPGTNPGSPTYSSDFCLSTDNEDPEYNNLRRQAQGLPPGPGDRDFPNALSSPASYTTDEERGLGIFPALDEGGDGLMDVIDSTALSPNSGKGSSAGKGRDLPQSVAEPRSPPRHNNASQWDNTNTMSSPMNSPGDEPGRIVTGSGGSGKENAGNAMNSASHSHSQKVPVSPRFTFEGEDNDAFAGMASKSPCGADRPPSPLPGFPGLKQPQLQDANAGGAKGPTSTSPPVLVSPKRALSPRTVAIQQARRSGAISPSELYPDSTDSELDSSGAGQTPSDRGGGAAAQANPLLPPPVVVSPTHSQRQQQSALSPRSPTSRDVPQQVAPAPPPADDGFADFGNFANFDSVAFPPAPAPQPQDEQQRSTKSDDTLFVDTAQSLSPRLAIDDVDSAKRPSSARSAAESGLGSSGCGVAVSPLSDLLVRTNKGASGRRSRRAAAHAAGESSSSVNSAPVITAAFLRKHHNLGGSKHASSSKSVAAPNDAILAGFLSTSGERASSSSRRHRSSPRESSEARSEAKSGTSVSASSGAAASAKDKLRKRRKEKELVAEGGAKSPSHKSRSSSSRRHRRRHSHDHHGHHNSDDDDNSDNGEAESWLFDEVTGALGPRGIAADLESLSGRSARSKSSTGNKSHKSHRSHRSHRSHKSSSRSRRHRSSNDSVGSRNSRASRYSHRSARSQLSHMSEQSRSVANDLLRLEMQLAMVGKAGGGGGGSGGAGAAGTAASGGGGSVSGDRSVGSLGLSSRASRTSRRTAASSSSIAKRTKVTVVAPPGKLGIILANKTDAKGTVVSGVRTSSVLADRINPGDRIVAIDGEDVSRMTVSEITTIMARKSEFERVLTVLTTPKQQPQQAAGRSGEPHHEGGGNGDHGSVAGTSVSSYSQYASGQ